MNINVTGKALVFKNEGQYGPYYRTSLGKKKQDGGYDNANLTIKFTKGNEPTDERTKIDIKEGFLSFTLKDKTPIFYIMCMKYELDDPNYAMPDSDAFAEVDEDCPF